MAKHLIDDMTLSPCRDGVWRWTSRPDRIPFRVAMWPDFAHLPWLSRFLAVRRKNRKGRTLTPINMVQGTDGIWRNTSGPRARRKRTATKPTPSPKPRRTPDFLHHYPPVHPNFKCAVSPTVAAARRAL